MMVKIEEALKIIKSQKVLLKEEIKNLNESVNYALAEDINAPFDLPSFDNSAMDGYALCGSFLEYKIVGEVAAGDELELNLSEGEAVRIFTGAKLPLNTFAIAMQEKVTLAENKLCLEEFPKRNQFIRKQGAELPKGKLVFKKGYGITPAGIGLLGSFGLKKIEVFKKPMISIITTGNELVEPGDLKAKAQIYESNSYALEAACNQFGFYCVEKKRIEDNFQEIKKGIETAFQVSDLLILSGGISVGDYDFVKKALEENEVEQQFYQVFQKPGKPIYFGKKGDKFVFALPGNPASTLTCFYVYVLPFLYQLSGSEKTGLPCFSLPIAHNFEHNSDRPSFLKAKIIDGEIEILDGQGSSMISSMAFGNALAFIDIEKLLKKGDKISCMLIP
ncbi:molybdopterin molybdotransferase [Pedobacter sp. UYEF25]